LIIIENPQNLSDERAILRALGKEGFEPAEEVTLDDAYIRMTNPSASAFSRATF